VLTGTPELEHKDVPTLRDFYRQTFEPKVLPLFRKNTRVRYQALWRQRVDKAFGAERLDAITQADLRGFVRSIELEKRTAKGPVAFVGTLLREAAQLGLIDEAPRLPPGVLKEAKKLPAAPSLAEVEHLIAKASGWVRVALGLGVYAGLRSGEIRALQARDVDLDTCLIRVVRTLSEDEEEEPKGDKERTVPVVPQLARSSAMPCGRSCPLLGWLSRARVRRRAGSMCCRAWWSISGAWAWLASGACTLFVTRSALTW
jgi:integrase